MTFREGQKVVCIVEGKWRPQPDLVDVPVKGCVYTVAEVRCVGADVGLLLLEIRNPVALISSTARFAEPSFDASQFRPIVDKKTDIGFAHEILRKASKRETLPA